MKIKNKTIFPILAALIIAAAGCSKKEAPKKPEGAAAAKPSTAQIMDVKTVVVEARTVDRSVEATGTLLPWDESIVSSEVHGTIDKISADLGDRVKAGQTLAILDQREMKINHADAEAAYKTSVKALEREKARLSDAATTLKRYEELFKQGMVAASQYDNARTSYDVAQAQVNEAEAKVEQSLAKLNFAEKRLADITIKSPLTGEIKKRNVSTGESVEIGKPLFTVVSTGTLKFRGTIAEASVPDVKAGQQVLINVEAFKDKVFKGQVTRISPAVDMQTRTLEIEASVPNPQGVLKPGFFARGMILTRKEANVPFVPESAVYTFVGITKVFVINNNTAAERLVKTGVRQNDMVEIIDKIKPGDTVATTNLSNIFDGAKVNILTNK
ncbi:MAG: efflux RND transporter periplasmic adaptor subunit [Deltaproteobacteria bacterium]|nr:efflux RND transporter periplasmic adaptor subunit [Deltaproteobacteria bacterium]